MNEISSKLNDYLTPNRGKWLLFVVFMIFIPCIYFPDLHLALIPGSYGFLRVIRDVYIFLLFLIGLGNLTANATAMGVVIMFSYVIFLFFVDCLFLVVYTFLLFRLAKEINNIIFSLKKTYVRSCIFIFLALILISISFKKIYFYPNIGPFESGNMNIIALFKHADIPMKMK